jgi:hypothetical protein
LAAELARILGGLAAAGIEAVPYKGPTLAAQAYQDLTLREFEDLDIVIQQGSVPAAHAAMRELGFTPRYPWLHETAASRSFVPGEYAYQDAAGRVFVEIHTERTLRHFPQRPDLDAFFSRSVLVDVGGTELRTFAPEDQLIFLSVHGAKDFWSGWCGSRTSLRCCVPRPTLIGTPSPIVRSPPESGGCFTSVWRWLRVCCTRRWRRRFCKVFAPIIGRGKSRRSLNDAF